ncbi:serine/threonine-protein kinase [Nocardia sp. SSK8]|uniref:serine/threonine-protein kinase n=1 Tax=Nocardia sp. SSK8 TaxID=3120154 RepID=UPI00300A399F
MHGVELGVGTVFAGYRIVRMLGRGGMGTVYLAAHPRLPRQVALKLLNRELSTDAEVRGRFEREADVSSRLDHPGIVSVLDRGVEDGLMWISMQYVDGTDASVFRGKPLDPARAIGIIAQTAEALDYAHERDVLHRDVKPANILLAAARTGDRVVLTDFGIARLRGDARQLTRTGDFLATLAYASPEQLSGAEIDHRSDQYSLGCTLYTLLAGESPFPADNPGAVVAAHLTKPVPRVSAAVGHLPAGIDAVIARALAKAPGERFDSCVEFAQAAAEALAGEPGRGGANPVLADTSPAPTGGGSPDHSGRPLSGPSAPPARPMTPPAAPVSPGGGPHNQTVRTAPAESVSRRPSNPVHGGASSPAHGGANNPAHGGTSSAAQAANSPAALRTVSVRPGPAPTPHHPSGAHPTYRDPARRAGDRRVSAGWRTLSVLLVGLAVLGVAAIGAAGVYWKFIRPHRLAPTMPWGQHHSIAVAYPRMIPTDPQGVGWRDARCSGVGTVVALAGDPVPLGQIICTQPDGVTIWYTKYGTSDEVTAYLTAHTDRVAERDFTRMGTLVLFRPTDPAAPFTLATHAWITPGPDTVLVEVAWPDHTFDDLRAHWWDQAPL